MPKLRDLSVFGCTWPRDEHAPAFAAMLELERLCVDEPTAVIDTTLAQLSGMRRLAFLDIRASEHFTPEGLPQAARQARYARSRPDSPTRMSMQPGVGTDLLGAGCRRLPRLPGS